MSEDKADKKEAVETVEAVEAAGNPQEQGPPTDMSTEDAINLLVGVARNSRLTYQEHQTLDVAVKTLLEALNGKK